MDSETAAQLAGTDPDYHVKDLFSAIEKGDYPSWIVYIQVMSPEEVATAPIDVFDCTYTWPHEKYPLRRVGRMTLKKNVSKSHNPREAKHCLSCNYYPLHQRQQLAMLTPCHCSPIIISKTSNKPASLPLTWYPALALQQTQYSKHACSVTPTPTATVLGPTIFSSHPIDPATKSTHPTSVMVPAR